MFGTPITLFYSGDSHYRTKTGSTLTILYVGLVLAFLGHEIYKIHGTTYLNMVGDPI